MTGIHRKRPRRAWKIIVTIVGAFVAVAVLVSGVFLWNLSNSFESQATKVDLPNDRGITGYTPPNAVADSINILLIGSDARGEVDEELLTGEPTGQRSDVLMLVNVPSDRSSAHVISIMRDSWVDIPGHGMGKINWAMAYGGMPLAIATVEQLLGARIEHGAIVGFEAFAGITDALGGVTVKNSIAFDARGSQFAQGEIVVNGADALNYVRERYAFKDGDYQRVRNQQAFLQGVIGKVLSASTLTSPATVYGLVDKLSPYLTVDTLLTPTNIADIALSFGSLRKSDIQFMFLPNSGTGMVGDQSVVLLDEEGLALLREAFADDDVTNFGAQWEKRQS